jgi:hypothetical protein
LILNKNRGNRIDVLAAKAYFEKLYESTKYSLCLGMIRKIESIEVSEIKSTQKLEEFIRENERYLKIISDFSAYEFSRLNEGVPIDKIQDDREFLNSVKD